MVKGYLCIVLHAHLPFVRHPEYPSFLEEDWLYEAITETYLPLLQMLQTLERDGTNACLTLSVSPTLAAMLADDLLQTRYVDYLDNLIELAEREIERTRWMPEFRLLARNYHAQFTRCRDLFVNEYGGRLLPAFAHHDRAGRLELITCSATHGFLPLMNEPKAVWAQVEVGCREFERHFGRRPRGIWLPECGYFPGLDVHLRDAGLDYFFLETHGILHASPRPNYGVYSPIRCPDSGLFAFGRDMESSKQVWSSVEGYPGDPCYREFFRDIGFDLEYEYLRPYLHGEGIRSNTGIKYYRITGATDCKEPYDPTVAFAKATEHAEDFAARRAYQVDWLVEQMSGRCPVIVAPYDAELFGHWWFEGPLWLEQVLRSLDRIPRSVRTVSITQYLCQHASDCQVAEPAASSWGANGYQEMWLNASNDWIYPHLHEAATRMTELAQDHLDAQGVTKRAITQAARELLLAQSSDWAFIMKTGTNVQYAVDRTKTHLLNFQYLYRQLKQSAIDEDWLREIEHRHNCFPTLDYRVYC